MRGREGSCEASANEYRCTQEPKDKLWSSYGRIWAVLEVSCQFQFLKCDFFCCFAGLQFAEDENGGAWLNEAEGDQMDGWQPWPHSHRVKILQRMKMAEPDLMRRKVIRWMEDNRGLILIGLNFAEDENGWVWLDEAEGDQVDGGQPWPHPHPLRPPAVLSIRPSSTGANSACCGKRIEKKNLLFYCRQNWFHRHPLNIAIKATPLPSLFFFLLSVWQSGFPHIG